jgi:hypothetical protein
MSVALLVGDAAWISKVLCSIICLTSGTHNIKSLDEYKLWADETD